MSRLPLLLIHPSEKASGHPALRMLFCFQRSIYTYYIKGKYIFLQKNIGEMCHIIIKKAIFAKA